MLKVIRFKSFESNESTGRLKRTFESATMLMTCATSEVWSKLDNLLRNTTVHFTNVGPKRREAGLGPTWVQHFHCGL